MFWNSRYICLPCIRHSTLKRLWIQKLVKCDKLRFHPRHAPKRLRFLGMLTCHSNRRYFRQSIGTPVRRICLGCRVTHPRDLFRNRPPPVATLRPSPFQTAEKCCNQGMKVKNRHSQLIQELFCEVAIEKASKPEKSTIPSNTPF